MADHTPRPTLLQYQIVIGALVWGLLCFAGIAYFFAASGKADGEGLIGGILMTVGTALLAGGFIAGLLVRRFSLSRLRSRSAGEELEDAAELLPAFGNVTIIRAALAEGPGFLFLITYWFYGQAAALAGAALALAALAAVFPTRGSFEGFVNQALDRSDFVPR